MADDIQQKRADMFEFWSQRAALFGADPRANTNDVWLREVEIAFVHSLLQEGAYRRVLDFGCANGYSTLRLAKLHPGTDFIGIDINPDMIDVANKSAAELGIGNARFECRSVVEDPGEGGEDFVFAIRVFQNIESEALQRQVFDAVAARLARGGRLLTVESYLDRYIQLNEDRVAMRLPPLPIHKHLTLLTPAFDAHAASRLTPVSVSSLSSTYYIVTRLLYSSLAKETGEPIDYNHPIHRIAASLPQVGDYGPQRACLYSRD